ncbi:hypothetical protein VIM7927_03015 [Vibrio mangrovi]|uniref:Uncharacterized protein n=1 Tax=Vibrio mangrovi TaxID=474394 RepID=A0A1Y6IY08_9VIBR|nr:hypothetical protein VIM7927_03015 [Vibrio mangrovi]
MYQGQQIWFQARADGYSPDERELSIVTTAPCTGLSAVGASCLSFIIPHIFALILVKQIH